jgi:hypothetical protein
MLVVLWLVAITVLGATFVGLALVIEAPVAPARVQVFARQYGLRLTTANASAVMRYLGTTRRWRVFGAVAGLALGAGAGLSRHSVELSFGYGFMGWFAGAVVAEWRVGLAPAGTRRSAALSPRRQRDYARPHVALTPALSGLAVVALAVLDLVVDDSLARREAVMVLLAAAAAVAAVGVVVQRHVLSRPRPADLDPSVLHADDVIRRTSLHVVAGSVTALLWGFGAGLVLLSPVGHPGVTQVGLVVAAAGAVLGWLVAASEPRSTRREPEQRLEVMNT